MENYIFGIRPILEALKSGNSSSIDKILVSKTLTGELASELFKELRKNNINIQYVPVEKINTITNKNHQGVLAYISPIEYQDIETVVSKTFETGRLPLIVILDSITDVRNFGAIARSCECAGVNAIIIPSRNNAKINEDAIKTSSGALFNIPVCKVDNLVDSILLLQQMGLTVFAVSEKTNTLIYDENFTQPTALIFGSEDTGISNQLLKRANNTVKIPMTGKTESLNVSVSAAIAIYEVIRQRNYAK